MENKKCLKPPTSKEVDCILSKSLGFGMLNTNSPVSASHAMILPSNAAVRTDPPPPRWMATMRPLWSERVHLGKEQVEEKRPGRHTQMRTMVLVYKDLQNWVMVFG
jgi:hypothetical protein